MPELKPIGPTTLKELGDYEGVSPASFKKIIDTCPSPPLNPNRLSSWMNGHIHKITPVDPPSKTTNYVRLKQHTGGGGLVGGYYFEADKPVASTLSIYRNTGIGAASLATTIQKNATKSRDFLMNTQMESYTVSPTEDSTYKYQIIQVIS